MTHIWCEKSEQADAWRSGLAANTPLYLDTEFMRERTYWPQLALMQVHDGNDIWLFDTPRLQPQVIADLVTSHPLVMHACSEDLEAISAFCGVLPESIEDTQVAAALCGEDMQMSYQKLIAQYLNVDVPKGATRTNWLARPLSDEQLHYAEDDVKYLPEVTAKLRAQLVELERVAWWQEECERLLKQAAKQAEPHKAWRQVKGAGLLSGRERAVLSVLAPWRNSMAIKRNLPKSFVVKDAELLELARIRNVSRQALADVGLHPKLIRRDGDALLDLLSQGQTADIPAALPGPPSAQEKAQAKALRKTVASAAQAHNLKPDVLMRRRWLEALIRNPEKLPEPLTGWRYNVVTRPLLETL